MTFELTGGQKRKVAFVLAWNDFLVGMTFCLQYFDDRLQIILEDEIQRTKNLCPPRQKYIPVKKKCFTRNLEIKSPRNAANFAVKSKREFFSL